MGGDAGVPWFSRGEEETVRVEEKMRGLAGPRDLKSWKLHDCPRVCLRQRKDREIN